MSGRPRSFTPWLIALLVLLPLGVATLLVAVFPLAECPQPLHRQEIGGAWGKYRCFRCRDRGRITLLNKWRDGTDSWAHWEGMEISKVTIAGFVKTNPQRAPDVAGLRVGIPMTDRRRNNIYKQLILTGDYDSVDITVNRDLSKPGKVTVDLTVREK